MRKILDGKLNWKRIQKIIILLVVDILLINFALYGALWLRFDGEIPRRFLLSFQELIFPYTLLMIICFFVFGLYHRLWRYAGLEDLFALAGAVTVGMLLLFFLAFLPVQEEFLLPRSVLIIGWLKSIALVGFSRLAWKFFRSNWFQWYRRSNMRPVLIVGAGDAGSIIAKELKTRIANRRNAASFPVGFVDDDPGKKNQKMYGVSVLGGRQDIPYLVKKHGIKEVIIAMPSASSKVIRDIVDICYSCDVQLKILPGIYELIDGRISINQVREVKVEDLLNREPVEVNLDSIAGYLKDKVVLVLGAGGSIGSELCKQVLRFDPQKLIMLDHSENSVYDVYQRFSDKIPYIELEPVIADIKDKKGMEEVFARLTPQVVFHAAAHKHVPLVERNPAEALKNNVLGSWNVIQASHRCRAEAFIFISSDKAVNPSSIMGATKRISEILVQNMASCTETRFAAVRFGNVLDSRGSVVPLFKKQIKKGGPVTITHPDMTRYFMTIPEAVQLVIQAGAFAKEGEIFVLDMGQPINILGLARKMIKLAGLEPGNDVEIEYTGVRPGEKLHEELYTEGEGMKSTWHDRIYVVFPHLSRKKELKDFIEEISNPEWNASSREIVSRLQQLLPEFQGTTNNAFLNGIKEKEFGQR